jgi:N-acetylglutamate synthase-like GNAT family acetyltransferase
VISFADKCSDLEDYKMTEAIITIKKASSSRLAEVLEILSAVGLPHEGVEVHLDDFLIAQRGDGKAIGCVGMERHGKIGLLRSAAALPEYQGQGIGNKLIQQILKQAAGKDVAEVALLTTTAKEFFEDRFGFKETKRSDYESGLANSPEWNLPRCSSASFMTLKLDSIQALAATRRGASDEYS